MKLVVIVGPTTTGKTRLGVELAHHFNSEIISADSRQVYRGLDIGTGKDLADYSAVTPPIPYHLIDVADPTEVYSLFHYQRDCYQALKALDRRPPFSDGSTPLLMVGGTGLYIESIVRGFQLADVAENPQLRRDLKDLNREELQARLLKQSAKIHARTDCSSPRRLIRSLEIAAAETVGPVKYSEPPPLNLNIRILSVTIDRTQLRVRIADRLKKRLQDGMIDEVKSLLTSGVSPQRLQDLGLEYREIGTYLAGRKTYKTMVSDLEIAIGQFAKRQETWFRGMPRRGLPIETVEFGDVESALTIARRS